MRTALTYFYIFISKSVNKIIHIKTFEQYKEQKASMDQFQITFKSALRFAQETPPICPNTPVARREESEGPHWGRTVELSAGHGGGQSKTGKAASC